MGAYGRSEDSAVLEHLALPIRILAGTGTGKSHEKGTDRTPRQRALARAGNRAQQTTAGHAASGLAAYRFQARLRRFILRRLHRASGWDSYAVLRNAGRQLRRTEDHYHRRCERARQSGRDPESLWRLGRRAMWFLYTGFHHASEIHTVD